MISVAYLNCQSCLANSTVSQHHQFVQGHLAVSHCEGSTPRCIPAQSTAVRRAGFAWSRYARLNPGEKKLRCCRVSWRQMSPRDLHAGRWLHGADLLRCKSVARWYREVNVVQGPKWRGVQITSCSPFSTLFLFPLPSLDARVSEMKRIDERPRSERGPRPTDGGESASGRKAEEDRGICLARVSRRMVVVDNTMRSNARVDTTTVV
nr:hypothetical protein CFP56_73815 [Quercus suber]